MSAFARNVAVVLQNEALENVLEENRRLRELIAHLRNEIRDVLVVWAVPPDPEEDPDLYERDRDGMWIVLNRRVELVSPENPVQSVEIVGGGGFYPVGFEEFLRSEIRIGNSFAFPMSDLSFYVFVCGFERSRNSGQVELLLWVVGEFGESDERISIEGDVHMQSVPIEQYSELSGLSSEQIRSRFNIGELEDQLSNRSSSMFLADDDDRLDKPP